MRTLSDLKIKIFADGANLDEILKFNQLSFIQGFTTNPTLMKKAGVTNYVQFSKEVISKIPDKEISFEVFSDEEDEIIEQALKIGSWGENVFVKIPVVNTKGEFLGKVLSTLSEKKIKLNVTAVYTTRQILDIVNSLKGDTPTVISVFCGRMADAGIDPIPCVQAGVEICKLRKNTGILWASTREVWNVFQANDLGCKVITAPTDVIQKLSKIGKTAEYLTLETVRTFYEDAKLAGFQI
ncbi:MAG: transaldolase [Leptospiraceae bacterium]|nr:transaldolase [Leptospiraceae bacterium]